MTTLPSANKPPLTTVEHESRLERGWRWLKNHPDREDWENRFEIWLGWLRDYTEHEKAQQAMAHRELQQGLPL